MKSANSNTALFSVNYIVSGGYTPGGKEWEERFNTLLQKNDISSINEIAEAVSPLTANGDGVTENLYKLSAVIEYAGVSDTKDIIRLAKCLDEFV